MAELLGQIGQARGKPMSTFAESMLELRLIDSVVFEGLKADNALLRVFISRPTRAIRCGDKGYKAPHRL
jgi:hypothetical protein